MTEKLLSYTSQIAKLIGGGSVYYLTSLACGLGFAVLATEIGREPILWAFFGVFLPLPPLYFWFSSEGAIRRRLVRLKGMADDRFITQAQFRQLRHELLKWYAVRQFGRAGLEMPADDGDEHPPKSPSASP